MTRRQRIVVLAGPTASGKSALAIELSLLLGAEIVNADSQQVYRDMEVGTAKPTASERRRVPHHLLDIASLDEQLSAARFVELADEAIAGIAKRRRLPLIVGGSGLWLRALLRGLAEAPPKDPELRSRLEREALLEGSLALHERLRRVDPESAARLHPNDQVRIVRALEVHEKSGRTLSEHHAAHRFGEPRYDCRLLALRPDRETSRERIVARTKAMLENGWLEEVRSLLEAGVSRERLGRVLGYGEVTAHMDGQLSWGELHQRIASRTWQYAKRQILWLRGEPGVEWLELPVEAQTCAREIGAWLESD